MLLLMIINVKLNYTCTYCFSTIKNTYTLKTTVNPPSAIRTPSEVFRGRLRNDSALIYNSTMGPGSKPENINFFQKFFLLKINIKFMLFLVW